MEKQKSSSGVAFIAPGIAFIVLGITFFVIFSGKMPGAVGGVLFVIAGIFFFIAAAMNKSKSRQS